MGIENTIVSNAEERQNNSAENLLHPISEKWNNLAEYLGDLEVFDKSSVKMMRYPEGGIGVYIKKTKRKNCEIKDLLL